MEKLVYKIPVFEGPLDALLYLISKNKLDICDIPIADLLDQYLDYLSTLKEMDLEVTSDFLEMASKLVEIKSAMLLPRPENGEENDPRSEFVASLIEYKTCKAMAAALRERSDSFDCYVHPPEPVEHDETYRCVHEKSVLLAAYDAVKGRIKRRLPPPVSAFKGIVGTKIVSVMSRIVHVVRKLVREGCRPLRALVDDSQSRSEAVATFLAVLELVKSKKVVLDETGGEEIVKLNRK